MERARYVKLDYLLCTCFGAERHGFLHCFLLTRDDYLSGAVEVRRPYAIDLVRYRFDRLFIKSDDRCHGALSSGNRIGHEASPYSRKSHGIPEAQCACSIEAAVLSEREACSYFRLYACLKKSIRDDAACGNESRLCELRDVDVFVGFEQELVHIDAGSNRCFCDHVLIAGFGLNKSFGHSYLLYALSRIAKSDLHIRLPTFFREVRLPA